MSIEYVCIVGQVGFTEEERLRCYVDGCAICMAMPEDYLRVDGRMLCVKCAVGQWNKERAARVLAPLHHRHGPDGRIVEEG
jgi:hypothetical protein